MPNAHKPESLWTLAEWRAHALECQAEASRADRRTVSGRMAYATAKAGEAEALARIATLQAEPTETLRQSARIMAPTIQADSRPDLLSWWRALAAREARAGNRKGAAVLRLALRLSGAGYVAPLPVEA